MKITSFMPVCSWCDRMAVWSAFYDDWYCPGCRSCETVTTEGSNDGKDG